MAIDFSLENFGLIETISIWNAPQFLKRFHEINVPKSKLNWGKMLSEIKREDRLDIYANMLPEYMREMVLYFDRANQYSSLDYRSQLIAPYFKHFSACRLIDFLYSFFKIEISSNSKFTYSHIIWPLFAQFKSDRRNLVLKLAMEKGEILINQGENHPETSEIEVKIWGNIIQNLSFSDYLSEDTD